ncbi:hypothetical protein CA51_09860 [Rosistilla oblonga]|nr:hypothetical protein CA51_09860 [Rosistilla oblonga]
MIGIAEGKEAVGSWADFSITAKKVIEAAVDGLPAEVAIASRWARADATPAWPLEL